MNQNAFPSSSNADNDLQAQFDRWAATYDADVAASAAEGESGDHGFPFAGYDRVLARVVALAAVAPGMAVLELGPGTGNLTAQLMARGAAVWALDFSAEMLARARVRVPAATFAQAHLLGDYPPEVRRRFADRRNGGRPGRPAARPGTPASSAPPDAEGEPDVPDEPEP